MPPTTDQEKQAQMDAIANGEVGHQTIAEADPSLDRHGVRDTLRRIEGGVKDALERFEGKSDADEPTAPVVDNEPAHYTADDAAAEENGGENPS